MKVIKYFFDCEVYEGEELRNEFVAYCTIIYKDDEGDEGVLDIKYLSTGDVYEYDYIEYNDDFINKNLFTDEVHREFKKYIARCRENYSD